SEKKPEQLVTIELRSGERVEGTLEKMVEGKYVIRIGNAVKTFGESDIRRIDFGEGPKAVPAPPPLQEQINIDVEDADLAETMAAIAKRVKRSIFVDPSVKEKVTVSLHQIHWRDGVEVIARMCKCEVRDFGEGSTLLFQPPTVTIQDEASVRKVLQLLSAYSGFSIV